MNSHLYSVGDLDDRLLKLEKQNRRFKQLGAVVLAIAAVISVMGQAPSKKTVEANEFVLKDNSGKVRASLSLDEETKTAAQLKLFDLNGRQTAMISSGSGGSASGSMWLETPDHLQGAIMMSSILVMHSPGPAASLVPDGLRVTDAQGFAAQIGVTDLVTPKTGESYKTSAASIVLSDKDKNVIWKAP